MVDTFDDPFGFDPKLSFAFAALDAPPPDLAERMRVTGRSRQ